MKKFVLVNIPSFEDAYHNLIDFVSVTLPIGITTIAAVLEKLNYEVKIIDGDAEGLSIEEAVSRTVKEAPDFVGSTTMTATMEVTGEFYARLRKKLSSAKFVVGGPHASSIPSQTLSEFKEIDIVVIGEGDQTTPELMSALEGNREITSVRGIAFRKNGNVFETERRPPIKDLEKIPIPAFHLLNFDLYRAYGWNGWISNHRAPLGIIFTARGCIGKCNFCASGSVFGRGIRFFPMERIKTEIDLLVNRYNIRILYIQDDTFTVNRKLVNEICHFLIERGYNRRLEIQVSARVDTLHAPTLRKMREAGIRWICFGVESGNQRILDIMNKNITIKQIRRAFRMAKDAGLYAQGNYMIGHLGETWDTATDTINLALELKQYYASFAITIPFPGSELYQYCLDANIELPSWTNFGSVNTPPIPLNQSLDQAKLMDLRNIAVNRFFKRPFYFLELLCKFNSVAVLKDFLKMYLAVRKERKMKRF